MAAKEVKFGSDARTKMLEGVDTLANAVKGYAWSQGPECSFRKILWCSSYYERRSDCCKRH